MITLTIFLQPGDRVKVSRPVTSDHAFEGKVGTFKEWAPTGMSRFARLHLDGDFDDQTVLVMEESLTRL